MVKLPRNALALPIFFALATSASCVVGIFDDDSGALNDNRFEAAVNFSFEVPVQARSRIRVDAVNGLIELQSEPGVSVITITGRKLVGAESSAAAQQRLGDLRVVVDEFQNEVVVRTDQPRNTNGRRYEVDYAIVVPEDFRVDLDQTNGTIDVWGPLRDVEATNVNGAVDIRGMDEGVDVTVVNGRIDADMVRVGDDLSLTATNGNVALRIPTTSSAELAAQVVNGSITVNGLSLSGQVVTQRSLRGTLGGGLYSIALTTVNGNITISAN